MRTQAVRTILGASSAAYHRGMGGESGVSVGVHACCWFDDQEQRRAVVREFVATGLARGERVAVYTGKRSPPILDLDDPDLAAHVASGQLVLGVAEDAYFPQDSFDGPQRAADFATFAAETADAGYPALRVYADNGRMPGLLPTPDAWLEYELRVAVTIPRYPLIGLCGFSADDRPALPIELLDAVHAHNLGGDDRVSRFHVYGNADGSLTLAGEVERMALEQLQRVLTAGRPVLEDHVVSLRDVTFTDAAGATTLHDLAHTDGVTVVDVPLPVQRIWKALGLTAA